MERGHLQRGGAGSLASKEEIEGDLSELTSSPRAHPIAAPPTLALHHRHLPCTALAETTTVGCCADKL